MVKAVWKFPIRLAPRVTLVMPMMAQLLCVKEQKGQMCFWAKIDPETTLVEQRTFLVVGTGHELELMKDEAEVYVGSAMFEQGDFVFHLFEAIKKAKVN